MGNLKIAIASRNYSSWSLRAWLVLERTGAAFEEEVVPLRQPSTATEIAKRSPSGRLPALRDGPLVVWDSLAIAEYLAERFPDAGLWPGDPGARATARSVCAEMHAGFLSLRQALPMNIRLRRPAGLDAPGVQADVDRLVRIWGDLRRCWGGGGPFLFGRWGTADAFFTPIAARFRSYAVPLPAEAAEYRDALLAWPAFRRWEGEAEREPWAVPEYDR